MWRLQILLELRPYQVAQIPFFFKFNIPYDNNEFFRYLESNDHPPSHHSNLFLAVTINQVFAICIHCFEHLPLRILLFRFRKQDKYCSPVFPSLFFKGA